MNTQADEAYALLFDIAKNIETKADLLERVSFPADIELDEGRAALQMLHELRALLRRVVPQEVPSGESCLATVIRYSEAYAQGVARLSTGAYVKFSLTAFYPTRGNSRRPYRGLEVMVLFNKEGHVLAVFEDLTVKDVSKVTVFR
jgi:hypothetical protein